MRDRILSWLEDQVTQARVQHILRVETFCGELAAHHQLDVKKAKQAGLMHDLAKYFKPQRLLQMAQTEGLELDEILTGEPHLLHADVSAMVARDEFGVKDEEILEAIRNHTLGRPEMSQLSCVVYVADTLEPGRGTSPELEQLRQTCFENLVAAVWQTGDYSLRHLVEHQRMIHPRTILTRNWAMQQSKEQQRTHRVSASDRISA
ncbi:bis(5'-nucleosyl)-tetraphosphatase (symmetrical) YqeK [Oscillatoria acuminata]|uniref:bis(5'-nucleosyl)-tetraphosphatase (symmetrical) n=1 Tax=Oscillatoria acuminata PCC 6304 TaxID=56110 RepID=K9TDV8_9CYAN|nr:bis(5'-nucleosyl)-tetraphosphatase (symmetrical) YqeK [Oscillatoria acuminata]AFY80715.1 putative HD superfamily hydrolase of NAD metabolism [Oscillatoria acuminata PCC 6304]